jgi:hypothetical protein
MSRVETKDTSLTSSPHLKDGEHSSKLSMPNRIFTQPVSSQSECLDLRLAFLGLAVHNALNIRLSNKFIEVKFNFPNDIWDVSSRKYDHQISVFVGSSGVFLEDHCRLGKGFSLEGTEHV